MNQNNNSLNNIFKSGMFTSTPQKDPTPSPFGTNTSVFGSSQQQPFGSSNVFQSSTGLQQPSTGFQTPFQQKPQGQGGVFGALGSSGTVQPLSNTTFGGFGSNAQFGSSTPFGSSTQFGGNTNTSTFGTSTPFGSNQQQQPFGSSALGGTQQLPFGGTSTQQQQPFGTTASAFGSNTPSYSTQPSFTTQQQQPTFGSTTGWSSSSSVFGSAKPSLSFGNSIGSLKNGSRDTPYQDTRVKDGIGSIDIKHINAMNEYSRKSNDEVRHEDYNLGRKAITSGPQSSFGGSTPTTLGGQATTTTSPFVSTPQNATPFVSTPQSTTPFVSTPQNTTPFVSSNSTNPFLSSTTPSNSTTTPFPTTNTSTFPGNTTTFPSTNTSFPAANTTTFPSNNTNSTFPNNNNSTCMSFPTATTSFPTTSTFPDTFPDTTNYNTTNYNPTNFNTTPRQANYDDPFLLKDIKFERVEKKTSSFPRVVPKPIFSDSSKKPLLNLSYRPPRVNQKKKIYTEPSIEEARHLKEIESLVIGFDGKGRIQYLDKVSGTEVTTSNIEDKISFMKNEVVVSDPPGVGFNKRARVYVEGVFAFSKSLGDFIVGKAEKNPLKAIQERFIYSLKEDPFKKFIDYNYETGLYVYEVNHF